MKTLSPAMAAALASNSVNMLTAVYIDINDTDKIRVHSGLGSFTIASHVYTGVGDFGSIDAIQQDGTTSPNGIKLTLSGLDSTLISDVLLDGYQGREVKIMLGVFVGDDYTSLYAHTIYKGLLDTMEIQYGETATITVNVENALIGWFRSNTSRWNQETHWRIDADNSSDKFFEFVETNAEKEIIFDPYIRR